MQWRLCCFYKFWRAADKKPAVLLLNLIKLQGQNHFASFETLFKNGCTSFKTVAHCLKCLHGPLKLLHNPQAGLANSHTVFWATSDRIRPWLAAPNRGYSASKATAQNESNVSIVNLVNNLRAMFGALNPRINKIRSLENQSPPVWVPEPEALR